MRLASGAEHGNQISNEMNQINLISEIDFKKITGITIINFITRKNY